MENRIHSFKKGDIICKEGELELCMYELIEGEVGVYKNYDTADEKRLTVLNADDCATFGEMGLLENMPRSSTVVALNDVKVIVITGETFGDYFSDNPAAVLVIMQNMSSRIRTLTQDYLDACRAVVEAVEYEKHGKEKSSWFQKRANKFMNDYDEAIRMSLEYGKVSPICMDSTLWNNIW